MSFKGFFLFFFSFGGHFVKQSRSVLAILVDGHPGSISMKSIYFEIGPLA